MWPAHTHPVPAGVATSNWGDQNPMGCEFKSPAVNAAG